MQALPEKLERYWCNRLRMGNHISVGKKQAVNSAGTKTSISRFALPSSVPSDTTLQVVQSAPDDSDEATFVIEKILGEMESSSFERLYHVLSTIDPDVGTSLPLYKLFWQRFAIPDPEHQVRLLHLLYLCERLEAKIEDDGVTRIKVGDIDSKYRAVVLDVADATGCRTTVTERWTRWRRLFVATVATLGILPVPLDQVFARLAHYRFNVQSTMRTIFVPAIGRTHTMKAVLEEATYPFTVLVTPLTASWLLGQADADGLEQFNPVPFGVLSGSRSLWRQLKLLYGQVFPAFVLGTVDDAITETLQAELGIQPSRTVSNRVDTVVTSSLLRAILYYVLAEEIIRTRGCETLVVGSATPLGNAIMAAGRDNGVSLYHLRHSMITGWSPDTPFGSTEFVEGDVGVRQVEQASYVDDTSTFVKTGFQHFVDRYQSTTVDYNPTVPLNILVATQPLSEQARRSLVEGVLEGRSYLPIESEVTIKTHPSESAAFYQEYTTESEVSIVKGDLNDHLQTADLVIVATSNVGLEAILNSRPCLCINGLEPIIRTPPYARHGPIPVLTSREEVVEYFEGLTLNALKQLQREQHQFIRENIIVEGTPAREIAEHIGSLS
jgi:hypothetical protein